MPQTMFARIWSQHQVLARDDGQVLLYVDRHFIHDVSAVAFAELRRRGLRMRAPHRTFGTPDHYVPTASRDYATIGDPEKRVMAQALIADSAAAGVTSLALDDPRQGIVHVVGPEQGLSWPGTLIVCADSHTSTHGALGALAFGIGATEMTHVLATQSLWQRRPKTMRIAVDGRLGHGVSAKDVVLSIIARIGAAGAAGHVIEYVGSAITGLSMEGRLTVCNMSIEAGARAGMIAVDERTLEYVKGRAFAPSGELWDRAAAQWRSLRSDDGARFDMTHVFDAASVRPQVTWGTSPEMVVSIEDRVPDPDRERDSERREGMVRALDYMGLTPNVAMTDIRLDKVFIGSCTNSRIEDLRLAAAVARGRHVASSIKLAMVVPGSGLVKAQAEAEGLDRIFRDAGFEWREPGCSMCLAMNDDRLEPGERCASTSNRNFEGRQGAGGRTHLVSPAMAAAAAITGHFVDVRRLF